MVIGSVLIIFAFAFAILILGNGDARVFFEFIDTPTLLSFIFVHAAILVKTGEFKIYVKAMNALLSKKYVISAADKEKAINLFTMMLKVNIAIAVLTTLIGIILMLGQLEDPNALGPMIAVSLISMSYAAFLSIFLYPAIHMLKNRPNPEPVSIVISEKQVIDKLLELCYKQGISPEDILAATEIDFKQQ